MTHQDLHRVPWTRNTTADSLRTVLLILATVLVGLAVVAAVPDKVWTELEAQQSDPLPDWHGNVASERTYN